MYRKLKIHRLPVQYFLISFIVLLLLFQSFFPSISLAIPNSPTQIVNEIGILQINNFSPEAYKGQGQNWAIVQDKNGFMYFGNTDGYVLQYDGVTWRQIAVTNGSIVRSLAIDSTDKIYVGAQSEIGYLYPDSIGSYQYLFRRDSIGINSK